MEHNVKDEEVFNDLLNELKSCGGHTGIIMKEKANPSSPFVQSWYEAFNKADLKQVDSEDLISELFAIKNAQEISDIKQASSFVSIVLKKYFRSFMEDIIDQDSEITHHAFAEKTDNAITEPQKTKIGSLQKVR